jgi:MFS family permease
MAQGSHNLFYGGILALLVVYALREVGLTPAQLGIWLAVATFGPALAAIGATPVTRRFGVRWTPVAATGLFAADFLYPLAGGQLWLALVLLILARGLVGLGAVFLIIVRAAVLQQTVPSRLVGRVNAVNHFVEWGTVPLGSLLGGVLGQLLGLRPALFLLAAGGLAASLPWVVVSAARDWFAPVDTS